VHFFDHDSALVAVDDNAAVERPRRIVHAHVKVKAAYRWRASVGLIQNSVPSATNCRTSSGGLFGEHHLELSARFGMDVEITGEGGERAQLAAVASLG
jgi:hypothetical protein